MTPEQQLVQQIQQILASSQLERNMMLEDAAVQFAEMCDAANARLARCADYLDKGMRSEAVHEAKNLPNLLELAVLLEFDGVKKWRNLCADMELTVFQPLNVQNLERLKAALEDEGKLEPLLIEYRRSVYQGDHGKCIALLRQIREKDPSNPSWANNLKPLEQEELPDIIARAENALASGNQEELKLIYEELNNPWRVVLPPYELQKQVQRALMAEEAEKLKSTGTELLQKLKAATADSDAVLIQELMDKAAALSANEAFFDRPDGWDAGLLEAKGVLDIQEKRRNRQADFLKEVNDFQTALTDRKLTEITLRHEWERLLAWELPVSDMLKRQVEERLAELASMKAARRRIAVGGAAVLLGVAVICCVVFAILRYSAGKNAAVLSKMQQYFDDGSYDELEKYLENVRMDRPRLAQSPEVEGIHRKLMEIRERRKEARQVFDRCMEKLSAIRELEYSGAGDEEIRILLKQAEDAALAAGDGIVMTRLRSWKSGWENWQKRRMKNAGDNLQMAVNTVRTALEWQHSKPFADLEMEKEKIRELRGIVKAAEAYISLAGAGDAALFNSVKEELEVWERDFEARQASRLKKDKALDAVRTELAGKVSDLSRYKELLEEYIKHADADDGMAAAYRRVLAQFELYRGALALSSLGRMVLPLGEEQVSAAADFLEQKGRDSVWFSDVRSAVASSAGNEKIRGKINSLLSDNVDLLSLYYLKYREKGSETWKRLYYTKPLMSGPDPQDNTLKIYWGNVYAASGSGDIPVLRHTKDIFPNRLNTRDYDIVIHESKEDNRCEYAKFLFKFIIGARDARDMTGYLLGGVKAVMMNEEMEDVLRGLLIKRMLGLLIEDGGVTAPALLNLAKNFNEINTAAPWMNPMHPETVMASKQLKKAMGECGNIDDMQKILKKNEAVLEAVLNSGLTFAGICERSEDGRLYIRSNNAAAGEYWGIFPGEAGKLPRFLVLSDGAELMADVRQLCMPGMPVFAPAAGMECRKALNKLGIAEEDGIRKPAAWPENAWK